jgi:CRP/FNR family transcriptional regulator, anaerobic regulatory protein
MIIEQPLIAYFNNYIPLNEEEIKLLEKRVTQRKNKRKQVILQEGQICKFYTFVVEGCMRMYSIDNKGIEHNLQFAAENDWIADLGSFHSDKPSKLFIGALEPSILLQIEKQDLYFLYRSIPKLDRIFKVIIENKFIELQTRVLQNISSTALERYQSFLKQYPNLALRLPNTQIASYLGITPEFLSKMRGEKKLN